MMITLKMIFGYEFSLYISWLTSILHHTHTCVRINSYIYRYFYNNLPCHARVNVFTNGIAMLYPTQWIFFLWNWPASHRFSVQFLCILKITIFTYQIHKLIQNSLEIFIIENLYIYIISLTHIYYLYKFLLLPEVNISKSKMI